MLKLRILLALAALALAGCTRWNEFYGVSSFSEFMQEMGCVQEYGTDCETYRKDPDAYWRQRAATRAALKDDK
ncbi:MAG: hypothetical protein A2992_05080 [Elusimicrobia bacterium RIFCSPLOWO2_01_FULL_59_12]|nr:MAG: hypothetical protein A2992_05080 [Elusimicrobia bacterium RIFCSPLOWO2_01_FULL_59_12]